MAESKAKTFTTMCVSDEIPTYRKPIKPTKEGVTQTKKNENRLRFTQNFRDIKGPGPGLGVLDQWVVVCVLVVVVAKAKCKGQKAKAKAKAKEKTIDNFDW